MLESRRLDQGDAAPKSVPSSSRSAAAAPQDEGALERASTAPSQSASAELAPVLEAALILAALPHLAARDLPCPKAGVVIREIGVSRARAYELRAKLLAILPSLQRPVGRPPRPPSTPSPTTLAALAGEVRDYLLEHPGAVEPGPQRRRYSDPFRHFILDLLHRHQNLEIEDFAQAVGVPLRTLSDWRRAGPSEPSTPSEPPMSAPAPAPEPARAQRIQTILRAWKNWEGSFIGFCKHVGEDLRIPYGRTLIGRILEQSGVRKPRRRPGRSPDELALKKQFEIFFPGAQWSADSTPLTVDIAGETISCNVELVLNPDSGALVGLSVRNEEDSQAVVDAFEDAVETAGEPPLALLLDNRPSNHTEAVDEALGETLRIRATAGRPQNKAHSEGAFGLFSQIAPTLSVPSLRPLDIARVLIATVVTTWARTLNHKPRVDRDGRSRVDLYRAADPTPEEIDQARRALEELARKQEKAWRTRKARQDPIVRAALDGAFERLELLDPEGYFRAAIARYPLDHVLAGIAVFEGKRAAGTLPDGVDARYLLGIVRNLAQEDEGLHIADALWRARLAARDHLLLMLERQRQLVLSSCEDTLDLVRRLTDRATATARMLDRSFWLAALADVINPQPEQERRELFAFVAQRIHATYRLPHKERLTAVRRLAAKLLPLD